MTIKPANIRLGCNQPLTRNDMKTYSRKANRMPHENVKSIDDTELHTWFERDRAHIELRNKENQISILEFWDNEVQQAIEDGFISPKHYHNDMYDYAKDLKLI